MKMNVCLFEFYRIKNDLTVIIPTDYLIFGYGWSLHFSTHIGSNTNFVSITNIEYFYVYAVQDCQRLNFKNENHNEISSFFVESHVEDFALSVCMTIHLLNYEQNDCLNSIYHILGKPPQSTKILYYIVFIIV